MDVQDLSDNETPTKQHTLAGRRPPTHIQQRIASSGLSGRRYTLKRFEAPRSGESWGLKIYPLEEDEEEWNEELLEDGPRGGQ